MPMFILDASNAVSRCVPGDPTEDTPYSRIILNRLAIDDAVVPVIWAFEIGNSIFVSCNWRKRITEHQIREYLDLLKALPIHVETQSVWANVDLESVARRRNLTAYDVAWLHLVQHTSLPLAMSDGSVKEAAIAEGDALI